MQQLERVLKALANKRRLLILLFLKSQEEANVGAIAEHIELSLKATSRHLVVLRAAGIVDREQRSIEMYYSLVWPLHPIVERVFELL